MRIVIALLLSLVCGLAHARGALTTSAPALIIPVENNVSANWQNAGLAKIGGIPSRVTVCTTISPSGLIPPTTGDDASLITAAIAGCGANQVVMLATGTWNLAQSQQPLLVNKSISLRGTGATTGTCNAATGTPCWGTVIQTYDGPQPTYRSSPQCGVTISSTSNCPNGSGMFLFAPTGLFTFGWAQCLAPPGGSSVNPTTSNCGTTLTADAAQGDTVVHVTSTTNFSAGMWVLIDENPQLASTVNPTGGANIQASPEFLNTSNSPAVMKLAVPDTCCVYGFYVGASQPFRLNQELHLITNVNSGANTLTFDSPLNLACRQSGSHDCRVYWPTNNSAVATPFLQQAGIENMTLTRCNGGCVNFEFCALCWVSNVEANYWIGGAVNLNYAARTSVTTSYLHNCIDCQNNGNEYPVGISFASMENLIENNIITFGGKGMVQRGSPSNVVANNYIDKTFYEMFSGSIGNYWNDMGLNGSHYGGSHDTLFEGNYATNCDGDETHGNAIDHTFFRNQCAAYRTTFTDPSNGLTVNDCAGTAYIPSNVGALPSLGNTIAAGTYNSTTGVIAITVGSPGASYSGAGVNVTLQGLTGTGTNLFNLTGTWPTITASGTALTLQGPTGQGSITLTGGDAVGNILNASASLRAAGPMAFNYGYAFAFNVLGQAGMQSCSGGSFTYGGNTAGATGNRIMWRSGWTGAEWPGPDANLDGATARYLFKNSNYDYVNSAIVDAAAGYAHTAPNSLFLSSAPSYFGPGASCTYTWPWIDSTSGTPVKSNSCGGSGLPAEAREKAGTPFVQP